MLTLFMPTINLIKQDGDSDHEEETFIKQLEINCLCHARKFIKSASSGSGKSVTKFEKKLVTIEVLGISQEFFLGIKVQALDKATLKS